MISVAMATYNGEKYIKKQLDSILNQTLCVDEIIIVDDRSSDRTVEIIQEYGKQYPCIKFFQNEINQGYKKNFKIALSHCTGDMIFLCDQDDIWMENKVEVMISIMKQNPKILALASSFEFINGKDEVFEIDRVKGLSNNNLLRRKVEDNQLTEITFDEFLIQNSFQGCALVIRKNLSQKFMDCFTEELFHDWLINLLAAEKNGMYFINTPLFQYRIHDKNTIGINEQERLSKKERLIKTNTLDIRTEFARASIHTLDILETVDKDLMVNQPDYKQKRTFYQNHIEYLSKGSVMKLLFQNSSPYYKNIKTRKARVMDLFFALHQKIKK